MDSHKLKVFLYVYKHRSFSAASEKLLISQPTVSEHIKALEKFLGVKLFDRIGKKVIPTEPGHRLSKYAEKITNLIEDAKIAVAAGRNTIEGEISIGGSTIPGSYILPYIIARFNKTYADVQINLIVAGTEKIIGMLSNSSLCIGIVGAATHNRSIEFIPYKKDILVLAGKRGALAKKIISPEELKKLPFILREKGSGTRMFFESELKRINMSINDFNCVSVMGSTDAVKNGVKSGIGFGVISEMAVKDEIKSGILQKIKVKGLNMEREFYIAIKKGLTPSNACQKFLEFIGISYANL